MCNTDKCFHVIEGRCLTENDEQPYNQTSLVAVKAYSELDVGMQLHRSEITIHRGDCAGYGN